MNNFRLAVQLLLREWRSGELITLVAALVITVTSVLSITLITDRLTRGMSAESAQFMGGDLIIESTRLPDETIVSAGSALGFESARVHLFNSVVFHGDNMLLGGIKAVSNSYPLYGEMMVSEGVSEPGTAVAGIPQPGQAWVDSRVLNRLDALVGDELLFGAMALTIERVLVAEPDQGGSLFQLAPRILINEADLEPAKVLGPGSRIRYKTLFKGVETEALLSKMDEMLGAGHEIVTPMDNDNNASQALLKATQYIRIATLLTLVLAAIAIALTSRRYSARHYDVCAMLRCLGAQQQSILRLFLYQIGLMTLISVLIAGVLGWLTHLGIIAILSPVLSKALPLPGVGPWWIASGSAVLLIVGFAVPPILRLADTPPLRVLRRDLSPAPMSVWLLYGLAGLSQCLLLWLLFDDIPDILVMLLVLAAVLVVMGFVLYQVLQKLKRVNWRRQNLLSRSIRNVASHGVTTTSQIMAFSLTLMMVLIVSQMRTGLLEEWQVQLPDDAPNHFAMNLFPDQVPAFKKVLEPHATLRPLYPVVRGRIVGVNGSMEPLIRAGDNEREHNFTWTDNLPEDNKILAGQWPAKGKGISMEQSYAELLGLSLNDRLTIDIAGDVFEVEVTSFRSVVWESFSPNFYMVFSKELLLDKPTAYLTSFTLDADNVAVLKELVTLFPALTLIEIDSVVERMQLILGQVSLTVELVMAFVLLGGFAVLFAALQTTADERLQEGALMRSFGASRRYLTQAYLCEFGLLGFIAGLLAVIGSESASAYIYTALFNLDYQLNPLLWVAVPVGMAALVALTGYLGSRQVLEVSPKELLS